MARAEGGLVPSGVGYAEGCHLFSWLWGLGEHRELPQRGPGQSPSQKRILAFSEGHRTLIFVLIWQNLRGTICIIVYRLSRYSKFCGGRVPPVPRDLRPCLFTKNTTLINLCFRGHKSCLLPLMLALKVTAQGQIWPLLFDWDNQLGRIIMSNCIKIWQVVLTYRQLSHPKNMKMAQGQRSTLNITI